MNVKCCAPACNKLSIYKWHTKQDLCTHDICGTSKKRGLLNIFLIGKILTLLFYSWTPLKIRIFFSHIPPQRFHSFWKTLNWTQTCLQLWEESIPDQASNTLVKLMLSCKPLIIFIIPLSAFNIILNVCNSS